MGVFETASSLERLVIGDLVRKWSNLQSFLDFGLKIDHQEMIRF
jgi:hypothetical protein